MVAVVETYEGYDHRPLWSKSDDNHNTRNIEASDEHFTVEE